MHLLSDMLVTSVIESPGSTMSEYTITMQGTLSWHLLLDYDSIDLKNNSTIRDKRNVRTSSSIQCEVFKQRLNRAVRDELQRCHTDEIGASYKALLATVDHAPTDISPEIIETIETTAWSKLDDDRFQIGSVECEGKCTLVDILSSSLYPSELLMNCCSARRCSFQALAVSTTFYSSGYKRFEQYAFHEAFAYSSGHRQVYSAPYSVCF